MIYRSGQTKTMQIPLVLDPWRRFTPGWSAAYHLDALALGWLATLESAAASPVQVELRANLPLSAQMFNEASPFDHAERRIQTRIILPASSCLFPLAEIRLSTAPGQDTIVELKIKD